MPRNSFNERGVRRLMKVGGVSIALTIPIDIVHALKLKKGQRVTVEQKGKTIVIKDWKNKK